MTDPIADAPNPVLALNDLRRRILDGDEVTQDELRSALMFQRKERFEALAAGTKKKKAATRKTPAKKIDLTDLL